MEDKTMNERECIRIITQSIQQKKTKIILKESTIKFEDLLQRVLQKDPRMLVCIKGFSYQVSSRRNDPKKDYVVTMTYDHEAPQNINEIIVDDLRFDLYRYKGERPIDLHIVTSNISSLQRRLDQSKNHYVNLYEGMRGYRIRYTSCDYSSYMVCHVIFSYVLPNEQFFMYLNKSYDASRKIVYQITRNLKLPPQVKIFLAYSYLQQNCIYDHYATGGIELNVIKNPFSHFSYGPIIENKGICSGISFALRNLLLLMGIECMVIDGSLINGRVGHAWNIVKLGRSYYHIDAVTNIDDETVCMSHFMKSDKQMRENHVWDQQYFPKCSSAYDQAQIKRWLQVNGSQLIRYGIDRKIVYPELTFEQ